MASIADIADIASSADIADIAKFADIADIANIADIADVAGIAGALYIQSYQLCRLQRFNRIIVTLRFMISTKILQYSIERCVITA